MYNIYVREGKVGDDGNKELIKMYIHIYIREEKVGEDGNKELLKIYVCTCGG